MLNIRQAAEKLGLSQALLYSLCATRKIRHERHGLGRGTIRIPEDALAEYQRGRTVEATEAAPAAPPKPKLKLQHIELG